MTDIDRLLAAVDAGDDTALAPLADVFEEAGDPRAAGLRGCGYRPVFLFGHGRRNRGRGYGWVTDAYECPPQTVTARLPQATYRRLAGGSGAAFHDGRDGIATVMAKVYPTRGAALLALAAALAPEGVPL